MLFRSAMLTIEELRERSIEINVRLDTIFRDIHQRDHYVLTFETAAEIVNLLVEAKNLSNRINYHSILVSTPCSGPH